MKTIGLLGGTSWISTIEYYRLLNQMVQQQLGGFHSAKIHLHSIDYHPIKSQYGNLENNSIASLLQDEMFILLKSEPDCIILCNHSLHEFLPSSDRFSVSTPVFRSPELIIENIEQHQDQKVLLLGTLNTMTRPFYTETLQKNTDALIMTPSITHMQLIAEYQKAVSQGSLQQSELNDIQTSMAGILSQYEVDAIILACTELPLMVTQIEHARIIDPLQLQCQAAIDFILK